MARVRAIAGGHMFQRYIFLGALLVLMGCAAYAPDPRGRFLMDEWRSVRNEGSDYQHSVSRPWSQRLQP